MSVVPQKSTPLSKDVRKTRHSHADHETKVDDCLYKTREERIREKAYYLWLNGHSQDADENWRAAEAMIEE